MIWENLRGRGRRERGGGGVDHISHSPLFFLVLFFFQLES